MVGLDQPAQRRPRHHPLHFRQKRCSPGRPRVPLKPRHRQSQLLHPQPFVPGSPHKHIIRLASPLLQRFLSRQIGRELNKKWNVGAQHALYRKNGTWYHLIERFPGALFDEHGYIVFESKESVENRPGVLVSKRANWLNVPEGIAQLHGYVRVTAEAALHSGAVNGDHLREEISRLVAAIKNDIAVAGMEKTGVSPLRNIPKDSDMFEMLTQRWHEQKGIVRFAVSQYR